MNWTVGDLFVSFCDEVKKIFETNLKMNKLLLLALCLASASCLQLENICSSDQFYYRGERGREVPPELVNAFHKIGGQNITFKALNSYLIDDTVSCDLSEFKNATNFWEALRIKRR